MKNNQFSKESYFQVGQVPVGIGAQLKGWNVTQEHMRNPDTLPVVDFLAMTDRCPHDCPHCFTNKTKRTLSIEEIYGVLDQLADWNTHAVNFVGEGEPTIDRNFLDIVSYTSSKGMTPVVFTDAATRMTDRVFVREVKSAGVTIVPKCDSIFNEKYQNWVLQSNKDGHYHDYDSWVNRRKSMFAGRNKAVEILMEEGFNEVSADGTSRMGFDMLVTKMNVQEVANTLRFARKNNLWIVFAFYLPSGRCGMEKFDRSMELSLEEKNIVRELVQMIDRHEFGFEHPVFPNFITQACVEFMQIHGNGNVNVCPGYDKVIGSTKESSITELVHKVWQASPCRHPQIAKGDCPPRHEKGQV